MIFPHIRRIIMAKTFEQSKDEVARLVKHFETNSHIYRETAYKEAHARQEFIDPLFMALGWDVHNESGTAPDRKAALKAGVRSDPAR